MFVKDSVFKLNVNILFNIFDNKLCKVKNSLKFDYPETLGKFVKDSVFKTER